MAGAEENIANALRQAVLGEMAMMPEPPTRYYQTPIEKWFYQAFMLATQRGGLLWGRIGIEGEPDNIKYSLIIEPQVVVINWPVDYLISVRYENEIRRLAIECDGHEFHERTKEQAMKDRARDRALQEKGVTVFRFTGAELYRNAWGCAVQATEWAERACVGAGEWHR